MPASKQIKIERAINDALLVNEFKDYLKKSHPQLIQEEQILGFNYMAAHTTPFMSSSFYHPAILTISNPDVHKAYEQFIALPATKMTLKPAVITIESDINDALLVSEFKAYLMKSHPNLIQEEQVLHFHHKPVHLELMMNSTFRHPAILTISNPDVHKAYEQFIALPATKMKLKPTVITIESGINDALLVREFNNYLKKFHPRLIEEKQILGFIHNSAHSTPFMSTAFHHPSTLTISNPDVYEAYEQFMELPATKMKLKPEVIKLIHNVNDERVINKFKAYLQINHPLLIQGEQILDFDHKPAKSTLIITTSYIQPATFTISNLEVQKAYEQFRILPDIAFMLNPETKIISSDVDLKKLLADFKADLIRKNTGLVINDQIIELTSTNATEEYKATITIRDRQVYKAYQEFDFSQKKDKTQHLFNQYLEDLNLKFKSLTREEPSAAKEGGEIYVDLCKIQQQFFAKLTPQLKPEELQKLIINFKEASLKRADDTDKVMGHGWLFRAVEVVIKAIVGLLAGIGMVLGMTVGRGLFRKEDRTNYSNTFFTLHQPNTCKALSKFKTDVTALLDKLNSDNESTELLSSNNF